jgi:hypothetical protein
MLSVVVSSIMSPRFFQTPEILFKDLSVSDNNISIRMRHRISNILGKHETQHAKDMKHT